MFKINRTPTTWSAAPRPLDIKTDTPPSRFVSAEALNPDRLHHAELTLVNESTCIQKWGDLITDYHICSHPVGSASCMVGTFQVLEGTGEHAPLSWVSEIFLCWWILRCSVLCREMLELLSSVGNTIPTSCLVWLRGAVGGAALTNLPFSPVWQTSFHGSVM